MENNVIIDLRNISVKLGDAQILENLSMYIRDKELIRVAEKQLHFVSSPDSLNRTAERLFLRIKLSMVYRLIRDR